MNQYFFLFRNSFYFLNYKSSNFRFLGYSDRENCKFFNRIVHRCLWTKVQEIFHTCETHQGLFTM